MLPAAPDRRKVLILARYGEKGASSRIRHLCLVPALEKLGYTFTVDSLIADNELAAFYAGARRKRWPFITAYLRRIARVLRGGYDLVWIEKEAFPWLPWVVERLAFGRAATVVDFDDYWPAVYSLHRVPQMQRIGARKYARLLPAADAVTASNPLLAEDLADLAGRPVTTILNAIDLDAYDRACATVPGDAAAGPMRTGWIGTPVTARRFLPPVEAELNRMQTEGLIETVLIGAGDAASGLRARRIAWSEDGEIAAIAALDVGIMPLIDLGFERGKSGWKLVQFMAAGKPVVATDIGFNRLLVEDGVTGFLVASAAEMEQRLRQLAGDPALRQRMGAAAAAAIRRQYGLDKSVTAVAEVFAAALAAAQARRDK